MRNLRTTLATVGLILALLAGTAAQVRDPRQANAPATGTITGRVEIEVDPQRTPIRWARLTLSATVGGKTWTTTSDRDGRYRFDEVAAGDYRLRAEKPGFVAAPIDVHATGAVAVTTNLVSMQRGGAIEGRFIDDRGQVMARLSVTAERFDGPPPNAGSSANAYTALTDDLGRFRVHTLPAGRYRLYATPPPPASGERVFYPGTTDPAQASTVTVVAGETHDGVDVTVAASPLSPIAAETLAAAAREAESAPPAPGFTARISGRVTRTDTGQPIANATVQLTSAPGATRSTINMARTNADGGFEFARLAGSQYFLSATADGYVSADASLQRPAGRGTPIVIKDGERNDRADVGLTPTSAIEVHVLDEFGDPAPGIVLQVTGQVSAAGIPRFLPSAAAAQTTTGPTDDRGWFRAYSLFPGDYYVLALPEPFERSRSGFTTTFFPGTTSADAAGAVHIIAGMDALDVRFALAAAGTTTVSGLVSDASGQHPPQAQVLLLPTDNGEVRAMVMARTTVAADGRFSYRDVPEGTYVLQTMAAGQFGSGRVTVASVPGREPAPVMAALTIRPLTTARGRVTFEGDAARPKPESGGLVIGFQPMDFTLGPVGSNRIAGIIGDDWTFEIPGLAWHGVLRVAPPAGWALARVMLQGRDITDAPYDFQSSDVNGVDIVLTSRLGSLSGVVVSGGQPAAGATIVVFGADNTAWTYLTRSLRMGRSNEQGAFMLNGLAPGRYLAVAIPTSSAAPADPTSYFALGSLATPVLVTEGGNAVVQLSVMK